MHVAVGLDLYFTLRSLPAVFLVAACPFHQIVIMVTEAQNCHNTPKTGLYFSYKRLAFAWWFDAAVLPCCCCFFFFPVCPCVLRESLKKTKLMCVDNFSRLSPQHVRAVVLSTGRMQVTERTNHRVTARVLNLNMSSFQCVASLFLRCYYHTKPQYNE